jgi:hypothetical protein
MQQEEWLSRWDRTSEQLSGEVLRRRQLYKNQFADKIADAIFDGILGSHDDVIVKKFTRKSSAENELFLEELRELVVARLPAKSKVSRAALVKQLSAIDPALFFAALAMNDDMHEIYLCVLRLLRERFLVTMEQVPDLDFWHTAQQQVGGQIWGSHEASWLLFYEFMVEQSITQEDRRLLPLIELAKRCGWWVPYELIAVLQHRHTRLRLENDRLHSLDGPALSFVDGYCVWMIGGVPVDEQIVMRPETQTIEQIHAEQNVEVARIRIERYGWDRYLREIKAVVLDSRVHPVEGVKESLMHAEHINARVLVCACPSTGRVYFREVDAGVDSCEAAQLWLRRPVEGLPLGPELFAT